MGRVGSPRNHRNYVSIKENRNETLIYRSDPTFSNTQFASSRTSNLQDPNSLFSFRFGWGLLTNNERPSSWRSCHSFKPWFMTWSPLFTQILFCKHWQSVGSSPHFQTRTEIAIRTNIFYTSSAFHDRVFLNALVYILPEKTVGNKIP